MLEQCIIFYVVVVVVEEEEREREREEIDGGREEEKKVVLLSLLCIFTKKAHRDIKNNNKQQQAKHTHTPQKKISFNSGESFTDAKEFSSHTKVSMSNATTEDSEWMDEDKSCCDKYGKDMYEWHESVACESWDWKRKLTGRRSTRAFS